MSEERLVKAPENARVFVIPQEYLAICRMERQRKISVGARKGEVTTYYEQNEVAAAILRIVERWTVWKMKQSGKARDGELWVYIPQIMMQEWELLGAFSESRITSAFNFLVEKGFLQRRRNPTPGKQWDRAYQYLFDAEKIQAAIDDLPPFLNIKEWKGQYYGMDSSKLGNRLPNIEEAIPQIPTQMPEQLPNTEEESARASEADVDGQQEGREVPNSEEPVLEAGESPATPVDEVKEPVIVVTRRFLTAYREVLEEFHRAPADNHWFDVQYERASLLAERYTPEQLKKVLRYVYDEKTGDSYWRKRLDPIELSKVALIMENVLNILEPKPKPPVFAGSFGPMDYDAAQRIAEEKIASGEIVLRKGSRS